MATTAGWFFLTVSLVQSLPSHYHSCTFNFTGGARLPHPYCNASLPVEVRVADLLSRMTFEEKAASLDTSNPAIERLGLASMQGGECTHGVATGCGTAAPDSTGCPTSFPSGLRPCAGRARAGGASSTPCSPSSTGRARPARAPSS